MPLRLQAPQTVIGSYFHQQLGKRLKIGASLVRFSNDLDELKRSPYLLTVGTKLKTANTLSVQSLYTLAGPLKFYGEAALSASKQDEPGFAARRAPVSTLVGPVLETGRFSMRANYVFQNGSYLPLLGYYVGDRQGPFGEIKFRPFSRLDIYGGASQYRNNVERDPTRPTFRSSSESAGAALRLPSRFTISAQMSLLKLSSRVTDATPWADSSNRQKTITLSRPIGRHNIRFTARDFRQVSRFDSQRQHTGEIEDNLIFKRLILGVGVRARRLIAEQPRSSLFYRGSGQFHTRRFSVYANIETGSDLANRTLFATNMVSTTVIGGTWSLNKDWEFQLEAYRSNLITELNPQSIFVLQGQGVFVPGALATLNQWSTYFRVNRKLHWGKAAPTTGLDQYAIVQTPLRGSVEGFVMERLIEGNRPAEGVPVTLDQDRTVTTDAGGRFRFSEVPEGAHRVGLALQELPADFDPGETAENTIIVRPGKLVRADLDVVRLAFLQGRITGPKDVPVDSIVIRLLPSGRYTTPDSEGNFAFYNLREGDYELVVDERTLPEYATMSKPEHVTVSVRTGRRIEPVNFQFEVRRPEKPVRKVFENK